jgi:hypothetical protein
MARIIASSSGLARASPSTSSPKAGRGGRVLGVIESTRANLRENGELDSEKRERMMLAVRDKFGDAWVRDYDDDRLYVESYDSEDEAKSGTWRVGYTTADDGTVTLSGDPQKVIARTEYVSAESAGANTEESGRTPVAEIAESELTSLRERADRASVLESERDQAIRERDEAREANAARERQDFAITRARAKVTEANGTLDADVVDRIVEAATRKILVTADGKVDEAALDKATEDARVAEETYLAKRGAQATNGVPANDVINGVEESAKILADLDKRIANRIGVR